MLTNPLLIIIGSKRWSKILTKALNLNLVYGTYNISKLHIRKSKVKKVSMSEENKKSHVVGTPSTSGNTNWDFSCNTLETSNILGHSRANQVNLNSFNLVMMNPMIAAQGVITNVNGVNYCPANFNFYNEISVQECMTRRYYHNHEKNERDGHIRSRSMERQRERELLSKRMWENTNKKVANKPGFIFTVMSYNVLAQDLLVQHSYLYQYHRKESLDWNARWNNLFKEIKKFSPDILCLQEVQETHMKDYFSLLETLGYRSLYKRRTGLRTEGCAMYYRADVVNLVEFTTVEFYQPNITILNRDNVAIVAKFCPKLHPTREFVVATTHLLYNPRRQDVRVAQMQVLLSEVERISYNKSKNGDSYLPVIITGDLNSTPDSALYEFLTKSTLNYEILAPRLLTKDSQIPAGKVLVPPNLRITDNCQHADLLKIRKNSEKLTRKEELATIELKNSEKQIEKIEKNTENDAELFSTGKLSHNFAFSSVYDHSELNKMGPTTFQDQWVTVDYIFYSGTKGTGDSNTEEGKLKLLSRYRLPTIDELNGITIPNSVLGSDHLSLLAKFKLEY